MNYRNKGSKSQVNRHNPKFRHQVVQSGSPDTRTVCCVVAAPRCLKKKIGNLLLIFFSFGRSVNPELGKADFCHPCSSSPLSLCAREF